MTAEVFARAWLHRRRFRDEANGSAGPWLYGIASNVYRDSLRRGRVEAAARRKLGVTGFADDPELERVDERLSVPADALAAVAALPDADRTALELRVGEEQSYDDVAAQLDTTPQAARSRVSRALRRLNSELKEEK
jgi:RNA polymerase sigma-70 factor (ECF subfamily)